MTDEQELTLVGGDIEQHIPMPDSVAYQCATCPKRCWLESASQLLAAKPGVTVICFSCYRIRRQQGYEPDSWEWSRQPGVHQEWIRRALKDVL